MSRKRHRFSGANRCEDFKRATPRLAELRDEMVRANGGPLLRFERDGGGLCFRLACGFELVRPSLLAMKRRGWVREVQPFSRATMRETWMVNEHRAALSPCGNSTP